MKVMNRIKVNILLEFRMEIKVLLFSYQLSFEKKDRVNYTSKIYG